MTNFVGKQLERFTAFLAILGGLGLIFAMVVTCLSSAPRAVRRLNDWIGDVTGFVLIDVQYYDVVSPILGEEELVAYAVGVALFAALPWGMMQRGHVRIDIFQPLFGGLVNRVLDFFADLSLTVVAYLILMRQWGLLIKQPRRSEDSMVELIFTFQWDTLWTWVRTRPETQILGLKEWPLFLIAEFLVAVFLVVALFCCIQSFMRIFRPEHERAVA